METVNILDVTLTNESTGHVFSQWSEECGSLNGLFRYLQREYGRCTSKVYRDLADGTTEVSGWFFEKIDRYADTNEPYKRGAWCSIRSYQSHSLD